MGYILVKVFGGFVATILGWLLRMLWDWRGKYLISHLSYSGTKVEGRWKTSLGSGGYEEEVALYRFGHLVSGTVKVIKSPTKVDVGKSYRFQGRLRDGYLTGEYSIAEENKFDVGLFMLGLEKGGNQLRGFSIGYYDPGHQIKSWPYVWTRIS
ncbi:MAG: hypothetical protein ACQEUG_03460 [Pseudomonadota bacterium]